MPKFEGKLTDEEIRQTVAYILGHDPRSQSRRRGPAGRALTEARVPADPALPASRRRPAARNAPAAPHLRAAVSRHGRRCARGRAHDRHGHAQTRLGVGRRRAGDLPVGGAGEIVESEELEDGRYNILLEGRFRYRVVEEAAAESLPRRPRRGDPLGSRSRPGRGAAITRAADGALRQRRRGHGASAPAGRGRSLPSGSPRRLPCACGTRRPSCRRSSRRTRSRRASRR